MALRQIELEKILLPHNAATVNAGHFGELSGALQADRKMAEFGKHLEVAPGPTAKIKYRKRWFTLYRLQQRLDVLADVVIACAFPERFGTLVVMFQRELDEFFQILRMQF